MTATHRLKTWPAYFQRILDGEKTFEVRRDDRGFQTGDTLELVEYDPEGDHDHCPFPRQGTSCSTCRYTGRELRFRVGYIYRIMPGGLDAGPFVIMSLLRDGETACPSLCPAHGEHPHAAHGGRCLNCAECGPRTVVDWGD